jgi:hypothetical protein
VEFRGGERTDAGDVPPSLTIVPRPAELDDFRDREAVHA